MTKFKIAFTWVYCATNNTSQWVPSSIIKPVVKVVKTLFSQKTCGSVVEVRIKFVNDTLKTQHRKKTCGKCCK